MHLRISPKTDLVLNKTYTTHMAVLIKLVQATKGPVMELGSGFFSRTHKIVYLDSWEKIPLDQHWTIAFVDHGPVIRYIFHWTFATPNTSVVSNVAKIPL